MHELLVHVHVGTHVAACIYMLRSRVLVGDGLNWGIQLAGTLGEHGVGFDAPNCM